MSQADGHVLIDTKVDESGANEGFQRLSRSAETALGVFSGQMMTKAFDSLTTLGKGALEAGASFESGMAKVSTLFSGTDGELQALSDDILRLSSASGLAATDLTEAAYSALSASVPMEDLQTMLEQSSKLAAAGFTDIDTALSATAKTMNAYGISGEEAIGRVQRILMQTQNKGITTVGELGASLAQVTPTAASFGVSFEQVGAALAGMTAQGTPTAQATTQLNSLLAELGKQGTKASSILEEKTGKSFKSLMGEGWELNEVLQVMSHELPGLEELFEQVGDAQANGAENWGEAFDTVIEQSPQAKQAIIDMFGSIEAGKSALSIMNSDWRGNMEAMQTDADVVGDAYGKVSDTFEHQSQRIQESLKNIGASLFEIASGPIGDFAESIADALDSILKGLQEDGLQGAMDAASEAISGFVDKLTEAHPALEPIVSIITAIVDHMDQIIAVLTAVAGAMVALKILSFVQALMGVVGAIQGIVTALSMIKTFAGLVSFITTLAGGPLVLIVTVIGAIAGALIYLWNTNEGFRAAVINAWNTIVSTVSAVCTGIAGFFTETIPAAIQAMQEWFAALPGNIGEWLNNTISKVLVWAGNMASNASTAASNFVNEVVTWLMSLPGKLWEWLSSAARKVLDWRNDLRNNAISAAQGLVNGVIETVTSLPGKMIQIGKDIADGLASGIRKGIEWVKDAARSIASKAKEAAQSELDSHSPSRVFEREVGSTIPSGTAVGVRKGMPAAISSMRKDMQSMVSALKAEVDGTFNGRSVSSSVGAGAAIGGTTIYNDNHVDQTNTYNVPTATPSEVSKAQREAVRNLVGGVK
ncbi:MAG: phage tail tape measure protein [Prevotella sp.]|nr:phage tail tape measure protein [Prevotella sp.]